jgi:hypothetical protein
LSIYSVDPENSSFNHDSLRLYPPNIIDRFDLEGGDAFCHLELLDARVCALFHDTTTIVDKITRLARFINHRNRNLRGVIIPVMVDDAATDEVRNEASEALLDAIRSR